MPANAVKHPDGFQVNRFDRWIIRERDPHRPVYLLRFERFRWAVIFMLVLWTLYQVYTTIILQSNSATIQRQADVNTRLVHAAADNAYKECVQRNQNTETSRRLLVRLSTVGDVQERTVWKDWLRTIPATVPCKR